MAKSRHLGEFEILVLASLIRLGDEAYGTSILREIEDRTGRSVTVGALYATLNRLEAKAYLSSRTGEATARRGGRAKRYYDLTALGRTQLDEAVTSLENMLEGLRPWRNAPTA